MHSTALILNVFASLVSYTHGDLLMQSKTYGLTARGTTIKGGEGSINGTIVNIQVVYMVPANRSIDDVQFIISANTPDSRSTATSSSSHNYLETVPTAAFDSLPPPGYKAAPQNNAPLVGIPSQIFQTPSQFGTAPSPTPPQNFQPVPQSNSVPIANGQSFSGSPNHAPIPSAGPLNGNVPNFAPQSGSPNHAPLPSAGPLNGNVPNFAPQSGSPNHAPLPSAGPLNGNVPNFVPQSGSPNHAPIPSAGPINGNVPNVVPQSGSSMAQSNVDNAISNHLTGGVPVAPAPINNNQANPTNSKSHTGQGKGNTRAKRSVGPANSSRSTGTTYTVQNLTVWPSSSPTFVNLSPIEGNPWIKSSGSGPSNDNSTLHYTNARDLNLRAPITNVSASSSPHSIFDDDSGALTANYDSSGGQTHYETLQDLQSEVMKNATNELPSLIQAFFNDSSILPTDLETEVENEIEQMMNDEVLSGATVEVFTMEMMTSTPASQSIPPWYNVGSYNVPTSSPAIGTGTVTTTTTGMPMTTTTSMPPMTMTTGKPNAAGSGNVVISSWMIIFASSLIAAFSTIIVA